MPTQAVRLPLPAGTFRAGRRDAAPAALVARRQDCSQAEAVRLVPRQQCRRRAGRCKAWFHACSLLCDDATAQVNGAGQQCHVRLSRGKFWKMFVNHLALREVCHPTMELCRDGPFPTRVPGSTNILNKTAAKQSLRCVHISR